MSEYRRTRGGGGNDTVESRERSIINTEDEDAYARARDRSGGREDKHSRRSRSWTPERSGSRRRHQQSDESESDTERRSNIFKAKELEKEKEGGYRDDRSKGGRESSWFDRNRDHESGSKDNWKKRRLNNSGNDKEATYGEFDFDHEKNWESQRRERNERIEIRPGYRRYNRTDGGFSKTSSHTIEIQPKFHDDGRDESGSSFAVRKNNEVARQTDFTPAATDEQWGYPSEERTRMAYDPGDETQDKYRDDGDLSSGRNNIDMQGDEEKEREGQKGFPRFNRSSSVGPSSSSGSQPPIGNNQGFGSFSRGPPQGAKANRLGRGGRGRVTGRDGQRVGHPLPMMIPPFSPLGMPPPMQPLGLNMSPAPVPPMGLGVFMPPFQGPNVWPGARGIDMNMLAVPPGLSPVQPGPSPSTFSPNMGAGPNPAMYFNQPGPARGMAMMTPNMPGPGFNSMGTIGRGMPHDKAPGGWTPRNNGPPGKAPSRGEQNDYSQNFVDTGDRPQNFIRELELTSVVEDYPKLRELIQKKDEIVAKSATPPMYYKCDLRKFDLSPEFFGTKFDVILVDPPWEEYVHRAPGVADHMEYWTFDDIINLKIEAIADTPSFIFLWVGDGIGLEQGRLCLKKWGFRRCEDICWVKTNRTNATTGLQHDAQTLFQHSKEHCLMGIKGTVRRSTDGHIIHANIDTDIIIAEEPPYGSTTKPEDMYRIIEHFSLGRRRLELFGEDHNIRSGWLTVGKGLSSSNFNVDAYIRNFADKDGKVWQGGGGRNPPPDAPHLVLTTPDIEGLRPKSPPPKNQQQQQSTPLNTTAIPGNRRPAANSPQNHTVIIPTQEASLNSSTLTQWTGGLKPPDILNVASAFGQ